MWKGIVVLTWTIWTTVFGIRDRLGIIETPGPVTLNTLDTGNHIIMITREQCIAYLTIRTLSGVVNKRESTCKSTSKNRMVTAFRRLHTGVSIEHSTSWAEAASDTHFRAHRRIVLVLTCDGTLAATLAVPLTIGTDWSS